MQNIIHTPIFVGAHWVCWHWQSIKRNAVVDLIDRIAKREERTPLTLAVLDNAKIHHHFDTKKLDKWLIDHRLLLTHLPPSRPELNPIEIVWKQAKYHWPRFVAWSKEELAQEVRNLINGVGTDFIISFA